MKDKIFNLSKKLEEEDNHVLNLSASCNYISDDIEWALGGFASNINIKGYINNRATVGTEIADEIEDTTISLAKKLFNVRYANVQSYSILNANEAVYKAILNKGDKVLIFGLIKDEHITHEQNYNTNDYEYISYDVEKETGQINYDELRKLAISIKPKLILITSSSYSRIIDFEELKEIAIESKSYLMVNMDHISGLVAAHLYPNPCNYADIVTLSTNKTLRGPQGGLILSNSEQLMSLINKSVYPGIQSSQFLNVTIAKALCFIEALDNGFIEYQKQVLKNAKILCDVLKMEGFKIIANGTENHLLIIDVKKSVNMTGKEAESKLYKIGIFSNKCIIPNDPTTPFITSGIRLGTSALTTKGYKEKDFIEIGKIISTCLHNSDNVTIIDNLKQRVSDLIKKVNENE